MFEYAKLTHDQYNKLRKEVITGWPTGAEVDFTEAVKYLEQIPDSKNFASKLMQADKDNITLAQPRAGVALLEEHIQLLQFLEQKGRADLLPSTIDSYTRHNKYAEAQKGIEESQHLGRSMLNGFPAVNYGVYGCRRVTESVNVPVQVRHGTPDARLLAEITLAGGFTSYEGGGISYNIPYSKDISLEKTLTDWQYVDRLIGLYAEAGITINREPFGPLTGTLVPPCISHAVAIIEALLAAEQGVKNITVGYGQCGNLIQDVAAIRTLRSLTEDYCREAGFDNMEISTVFHQWMGGFPDDEAKAMGVISWGAAAAALGGATKVIVKSPQESFGIPTKEANAEGIRATKQVLSMLQVQKFPISAVTLRQEMRIIAAETRSILSAVFELGKGNLLQGTVRAFEAGIIDIPFAPSRRNAGKMLPIRDNDGAVRIFEFGSLPFDEDIRGFHKERISDRARYEKRVASFEMVIDDINAVSNGKLVGRP